LCWLNYKSATSEVNVSVCAGLLPRSLAFDENGTARLPARWLCIVRRPPISDTQETLVVSRACMSYGQNFLVCAQTCGSFRPELKLRYHENGSHRIE